MKVFALVDCNNFFVSCERVFNPKLNKVPVIVLSSNDGCVIARSNEAKALGIAMGVPLFKVKDLVRRHRVRVFSSNFTLYGDMSSRVMSVLHELAPSVEVYSIDEAFLDLTGIHDIELFAFELRQTIQQWTGLPVSIGIGTSKTMAKLANYLAKSKDMPAGVYSLLDHRHRLECYAETPITEVWGIGRNLSLDLQTMGIHTVADFIGLEPQLLRRRFSVVLAKTQRELQGISCLALSDVDEPQKSMVSSRSFGTPVTTLEDLKSAITYHLMRLTSKLRKHQLVTQQLYLYAYNSRFDKTQTPRKLSTLIALPYATNATMPFLKLAMQGIERIFEEGIIYKKAGIAAFELLPENMEHDDLFAPQDTAHQKQLSLVMDNISQKFGKHSIYFGALGHSPSWLPKKLLSSPPYTTDTKAFLWVK